MDDRGRLLPGVTVTDGVRRTATAADGTFARWVGDVSVELRFEAAGFLPVDRRLAPADGPTEVVFVRGGWVEG